MSRRQEGTYGFKPGNSMRRGGRQDYSRLVSKTRKSMVPCVELRVRGALLLLMGETCVVQADLKTVGEVREISDSTATKAPG